jgi:HK97 family phage major capsid protein/HK97 family phage prohead protease
MAALATHNPVVRVDPVRWNARLSKAFDVSREQFPPRSAEEALVAKYLEVEIKHLERREIRVPAVRIGAFLTAAASVLSTWTVDDVRNLNYRGEETPPAYDVIQLNSTKRADFLIDGMRFVRRGDPTERATVRVQPAWYGLDITIYGLRSTGTAERLLGAISTHARDIQFLKGEAFALSGEFLPTTGETFSDLFLDQKNSAAIQRIVQLVNTKGQSLENRGVILMGPPGTGKTLAARIVRNEAKATFIWVSSRDFHYSGSFGGFSQAFTLARECAPSVVVFEDVDNWMTPTTVDLIKTEMDGVSKSSGVVTMMTTNYPELLPAALIDRPGRFHDVLKFDLPSDLARAQMLKRWLPDLAAADVKRAVEATTGYSGAHIKELARFAVIIAEQDGLTLDKALSVALAKLAEQRDLITATQRTGSRYRIAPALSTKMIPVAKAAEPIRKAYSLLRVKSVDSDTRVITGMATTPETDRTGDIIEPLGVQFKNPLPLLLYHDTKRPVGLTRFKKPTAAGIEFEATIPAIDEPGILKDRLDEAWQSVKAGLVSGVSVGFRSLEHAMLKDTGGMHFLQTEVVELSLVTVPANAAATILTVKALDLAASGPESPGVTGLPVVRARKDAPPMTTAEQITQWSNTRAPKAARMSELMTKAAETGVTLDEQQAEEYDGLEREVKSIDVHLGRLRASEKTMIESATKIEPTTDPKKASEQRGGVVSVKSNLPKGTAYTRFIIAKINGQGSNADAIAFAKRWEHDTPEVELMLKATSEPGTIAAPAWAAPLAVATPLNDFLDLLRPATLLGKIPNLRKVPFNISMPLQTGGGTYAWVGEGAPKPVGQLQFASTSLGIAKAAGIIVISQELARLSTPDAEGIIRNDMINGMAQYLDQQFIDPTVTAVTNVSPASITNGSVQVGSAGSTADNARTDIKALIASFLSGNQGSMSIANTVLIMSESNAFALSVALNPLGQPLYPGLNAKGGTILGVTVVTSQVAGTTVALVNPSEILYADDGGVNIDVSREASVEMSTTPTSPATASSAYISLWQLNLLGLRAERFINWKRARLAAVRYTTATYA